MRPWTTRDKGYRTRRLGGVLAVAALSVVAVERPAAQSSGRDARDDGASARTDAILGTPNRVTPVPPTNLFSTSPGLTQQPPGSIPPTGDGSEGSGKRGMPAEGKPR